MCLNCKIDLCPKCGSILPKSEIFTDKVMKQSGTAWNCQICQSTYVDYAVAS